MNPPPRLAALLAVVLLPLVPPAGPATGPAPAIPQPAPTAGQASAAWPASFTDIVAPRVPAAASGRRGAAMISAASGSHRGRNLPGPVADAGSATGPFRWPLPGVPPVVRRFDPPPQPWLPGHRGVDLAAAPGAQVRAAGAGSITFAGMVAGRPVVTVTHAGGLRTTYEPVRPTVEVGAAIPVGGPIGDLLAGHPGCPAPACLHWGLRQGDDYLDPLALVGRGPVRLLPLDGVLRPS